MAEWHQLWDYGTEYYPYGWHGQDELELIELGERVSDWETSFRFALSWSRSLDRAQATTSAIIACIANAIREKHHRGFPRNGTPDLPWEPDKAEEPPPDKFTQS